MDLRAPPLRRADRNSGHDSGAGVGRERRLATLGLRAERTRELAARSRRAALARVQRSPAGHAGPALGDLREHALAKGVNPIVYRVLRTILVPFFLLYFRMTRIGREHLPRSGPLLLACNHRSFIDPFMVGMLVKRPIYYMAKRELFEKRWQARLLNALGAFPVDRGAGDHEAMATAKAILERGDCVVIFPEGTRTRPGPLGRPRRGVGRLALETGAPVAPIAVIGTEDIRRGWRVRPRKVRLRAGVPLQFPTASKPSPNLAAGVTRRIWACVNLQWEWLGGAPALREQRSSDSDARENARAA